MVQKEKKNKKIKTSEMLDSLAKEINYGNTPECKKRDEYRDEIEKREPFSDIKNKIDSMETRLQNLEQVVKRLLGHRHDKSEKVVIDINTDDQGRFL